MRQRAAGYLLFPLILVVLCWVIFAAAQEPPIPGVPEAMDLTADPQSIYVGGDTSLITATVYDNPNGTKPLKNQVVWLNTSLGSIANLSFGGTVASDECWVQTNESGMAQAILTAGFEPGNAWVYAWIAGVAVNQEVIVNFMQPVYGVALVSDNDTKETESNEQVTYYLEVKNIGTGIDTYNLSLILAETDFAELDKTSVTLASGESELVALTVASYFAGSYSTTVEVASPNAGANVTVSTVVKPLRKVTAAVSPTELQIVAPGVSVQYTVNVSNAGNAPDRFHVTTEAPLGVTATLSTGVTEILNPEEHSDVTLNVSSALEGVHEINLTLTSEGNNSVTATVRVVTMVTRECYEFDTGAGTYPSISGICHGVIMPNHTIIVKNLYTYPSSGTGGHTKFVKICNSTWCVNATWNGKYGDYLSFPDIFTLKAGQVYSYELQIGSYPQIIHKQNHTTLDDSFINCTSFVDANGNFYTNWIPAFKLSP